jgi:GLPGLI family protein
MKNLYFSLLFILSFSVATAQELTDKFNYKATYQLTWQIDSTDAESVQSEKMVLFIGDGISRFSSLNLLKADSLSAERKKNFKKTGRFMSPPQTEFEYKLFKNLNIGKLYFFERVAKDRFKYTEELPLQEWEIHSETKEISGYTVQKATTNYAGRDYVAWFTAEIPISDGPYKFSGLPGLIIEIADTQNYYHFKITGFRELDTNASSTIEEDRYTTVSKVDFLSAQENYSRDPLGALSKAGITIGWSEEREKEAKKELKENFKSRNNPIELE